MSRIDQIKNSNTRAFAEACYDQNSIYELEQPFCEGDAEALLTWGISKRQWEESTSAALADRREDDGCLNKEILFTMIREDGAEDWRSVVDALEDGAYLKSIGVDDESTSAVENAHSHALEMAESHPDYK